MRDPVAQMGSTPRDDAQRPAPPAPVDAAAHNAAANGELAQRRRLTPQQWQHIVAAYSVLCDSTAGRMTTVHYEVFRDEGGGVHVVIPPAVG